LFADDHKAGKLMALLLEGYGISLEIVGSAEAAVARIEEGGMDHVLSDGLGGGWKQVVAAAIKAHIPVTVYSSDPATLEQAELLADPKDMLFSVLNKGEVQTSDIVKAINAPLPEQPA
jgi:CheY-like chemotaxis protein